MPNRLIEFRSISKRFKGNNILDGITLSIDEGDLFGLIGVSGAGKTTLLKTLVGFHTPDSGQIFFKGNDITTNKQIIKHLFGFTSQDYSFYEKLTSKENLIYFGKMYGLSRSEIEKRAETLLGLVELSREKDKLAKNLSGGMQRRLDMACSLMHDPALLILDEPTTGLDPMLRKHVLKLIKRINSAGTTIIMSSHLLGEIEHICNRIAIINNGKILAEDTPERLKDAYSRNEEIHLETFPAEYEKVISLLKTQGLPLTYITIREHKLVVYTPQAERVLKALLNILDYLHETLLDVSVNKPSLAEVFEALTRPRYEQQPRANPYELLKSSIRSAIAHGYSKNDIRKELLRIGYNNRIVKRVMGETL